MILLLVLKWTQIISGTKFKKNIMKQEVFVRFANEGALFDHDGTALVDPARLVWGLEKACLSLGVKIYENSKVEELIDDSDTVLVKSAYGSIRANKVALATNVYTPLIKSVKKYVIAVYDFQLVTQPLTNEQLESIGWKGREGLSDAGYRDWEKIGRAHV